MPSSCTCRRHRPARSRSSRERRCWSLCARRIRALRQHPAVQRRCACSGRVRCAATSERAVGLLEERAGVMCGVVVGLKVGDCPPRYTGCFTLHMGVLLHRTQSTHSSALHKGGQKLLHGHGGFHFFARDTTSVAATACCPPHQYLHQPRRRRFNARISTAATKSTLHSRPQITAKFIGATTVYCCCANAARAWLRVLTALRDRKTPVQILVMGDSMLAGHGGYAKVFVESLNSQLGFFSVRLINIARGGTSTEAALAVLPALLDESLGPSDHGNTIEPPTILLMDYSINDGCQPKDPSGARLRAALESQIRWLLSNRPSLALLRVESYYSKAAKDLCSNTLNRDYAPITSHYSIPHFIYSKAVKAGQYEAAWSKGCGLRTFDARCSAHPPWETHELISYALTRSFVLFATAFSGGGGPGQAAGCNGGAQWPLERGSDCLAAASSSSSSSFSECGNKQLPPPISPAALLKELSVCTHPKTAYRAHAAFAASSSSTTTKPPLPVVFRGDWKLYEDRAGKPGWITTGPTRSTIEFNLTFGAQPSLAFSYLISHDPSYGDVLIRMRNMYVIFRVGLRR